MKTIGAMIKGHKGQKKQKGLGGRWNSSLSSLLSLSSLVLLLPAAAQAAHIEETVTLAKGWNAIYLESTPANPVCADFFAGAPVARVASYQSDAYTSTRQIADDGTPIDQKPVSYQVWLPDDADASTMGALTGGRVYMILATDAWSKTFIGVPSAPQQTWRATSGASGFMNIVGVSVAQGVSVPAKTYFSEGPFGTASGVAYQIGGTKTSAPTFLPPLASGLKVQGGKAYALSATKDGDWPGVIGVQGSGIDFGADANYASVKVRNCGTTNHVFRMKVIASADAQERVPPGLKRALPRVDAFTEQQYTNVEANVAWTVSLDANADTDMAFSIDRSKLVDGQAYGAILVIEDLGASKMRVRLPITAEAGESSGEVKFPVGLWSGFIQLETVSRLDDTNQIPVKAGGTLKMNVMMHVAPDGAVKLLQRVAAGIDTNGTPRLFKELESVPAEVENARRFSTVMMSIDNPVVTNNIPGAFGDRLIFDWTVAEKAADNPFRHAWHPDHDGKKADYSGDAPSGDDLANYAGIVKPELWSIVNRMEFSWHRNNDPHAEIDFEWNASEKTAGFVTWTVDGLTAKNPITSLGVFVLQRAIKAGEVE